MQPEIVAEAAPLTERDVGIRGIERAHAGDKETGRQHAEWFPFIVLVRLDVPPREFYNDDTRPNVVFTAKLDRPAADRLKPFFVRKRMLAFGEQFKGDRSFGIDGDSPRGLGKDLDSEPIWLRVPIPGIEPGPNLQTLNRFWPAIFRRSNGRSVRSRRKRFSGSRVDIQRVDHLNIADGVSRKPADQSNVIRARLENHEFTVRLLGNQLSDGCSPIDQQQFHILASFNRIRPAERKQSPEEDCSEMKSQVLAS